MSAFFSLKIFDKQAFGKQKSSISKNNIHKNTQIYEHLNSRAEPPRLKNKPKISFGQRLAKWLKFSVEVVEVEVNTTCNYGKCPYCPVSLEPKAVPQKIMPTKLFNKILLDLKSLEYAGKMTYHRYGEPLMINVEQYISMTKKVLPEVTTELFTNGILLTKERLQSLKLSGVDEITVTQHTPEGFINKLANISDDLLEKVYVRYGNELRLSNRAGTLSKIVGFDKSLSTKPCFRPVNAMIIDINGNVLICSDDYYKKLIMGNITNKTIEQIWRSEQYVNKRNSLSIGLRDTVELCKTCNREHNANTSSIPDLRVKTDARFRKRLLMEGKNTRTLF